MLNLRKIGARIASYRKANGMTQDDLAEALFLSRQSVSKWEKGIAAPSIENLIMLTELFHTTFEDLLCLDHSKAEQSIFPGNRTQNKKENPL